MEIVEEAFDRALNPIRATVAVRLVVAAADASPVAGRVRGRFEADQERLARLGAAIPPRFALSDDAREA
jgi:hypothetical protein